MPPPPAATREQLLLIDQDRPLADFTRTATGWRQSPPPRRLLVELAAGVAAEDVRRGARLVVRLGWHVIAGKRWRHVHVLRLLPADASGDHEAGGPVTRPMSFSALLARAPRTDRPGGARGDVGRKSLVTGEFTEAHSITLPASVWRRVEEIGDGNRSEGVRRLVEGGVKAEAQD